MKFFILILITLYHLGESAFAVPSNFEALVRDAAQPLLDKYALKYVGVRSSEIPAQNNHSLIESTFSLKCQLKA